MGLFTLSSISAREMARNDELSCPSPLQLPRLWLATRRVWDNDLCRVAWSLGLGSTGIYPLVIRSIDIDKSRRKGERAKADGIVSTKHGARRQWQLAETHP